MINHENLTLEIPPAEPVIPTETTAPADVPVAPAAAYTAPPATPLKKESAHRLFLMPNIFRLVAVLCMIAALALTVFQPVFTVKVEYDDVDGLMDTFNAEKEVSFSLYDLTTDLKGEIDLHNEYLEKVEEIKKDDDYDKSELDLLKYDYSAPEDSGKFSAAMTTFITNLRLSELDEYEQKVEEYLKKIAKGDTSAKMPSAPQPGQNRFNTFFFYLFIFSIPAILVVIFAINLLIRVIQMLILFIRPSPYLKKADAASIAMLPLGLGGTMAAMHYLANGFVQDLYALIPLAVLTVIGIVFDTLYRSTTKRIVKKEFDL